MDTFELLQQIEKENDCFAISLINGEKKPLKLFATQIALDILPIIYDILDKKGKVKNIYFLIRSNGGSLDSPLPIVNLLREYTENLTILIPENAHSAATLIALSGDKILMSPFGSLSPVDPQINIESNAKDNKMNFSFSVEDVSGYYKLLDKLKINDEGKIRGLEFIVQTLNPTILGQIERVRDLIHIIADKILINTKIDETKKGLIIRKLVEDIPSHSYRISRKEAKELGLPIEEEPDVLHVLLKDVMKQYREKMFENEQDLLINFENENATVEKTYNRAYIETVLDTYTFESKYIFYKNGKIDAVQNQWRKIR